MTPYTVQPISISTGGSRQTFYRWANALALITILYNLAEGSISVSLGFADETVALFGFGVDSFVEVISGMGIWHMIRRMRREEGEDHDRFEKTALKVTGTSFYMLTAGLTVTAVLNLLHGSRPETTFWGVVISLVSIVTMWILIHYKLRIGRRFHSQAMISDAHCTRACMYLSVVLLVSSAGYELTGFAMIDSLGALGIAVLSFREGREAFMKASGNSQCGCGGTCH